MPGGRPLKFQSVEKLQEQIDKYFEETDPSEITVTGLCLALETDRHTLINYEKKDEFFHAIKTAKDKVALEYEKDLRRKGRSGDIFALKNFGWSDHSTVASVSATTEIPASALTPETLKRLEEKTDKLLKS